MNKRVTKLKGMEMERKYNDIDLFLLMLKTCNITNESGVVNSNKYLHDFFQKIIDDEPTLEEVFDQLRAWGKSHGG